MSIYLNDGIDMHATNLTKLGPHTHGVGCLYIKDLTTIDLDVLENIVRESYQRLTNGVFTNRARDGHRAN